MRQTEELRALGLEKGVQLHASGSCLVKLGRTHVLCAASLEERVPGWMKGKGSGWLTAEYGMLPAATNTRSDREAARGKQQGRTVEIQRLIGRSLRQAVDLAALGERTLTVDCDVINADGGTRCAAITGAYVALCDAVAVLLEKGLIQESPILDSIAAISVGMGAAGPLLDLDYLEDSSCETDMNVVMTGAGKFVEIQGTAEGVPFSKEDMGKLVGLAENGIAQLIGEQKKALAQG